ncbi:MAG: SurA N-terminal domain-containing protein, partial [Bacteroidia bacterium]
MTILSSIRNRIGLIVGVIFVALLSFVLSDFIGGNSSMFGNSQGPVGEINGNSISYGDFQTRMQRMAGKTDPDPQMQEQFVAGVWDELETEFIFEPQWKDAGVTVTTDELYEQMMGDKPSMLMNQFFQDRQTGQINPQFANPDGSLSGAAIRGAVKQFNEEQEEQWGRVEKEIGKQLIKEKYNTLL